MRASVGLRIRRMITAVAAATAAAVFFVPASAAESSKVALVIGNGAYRNVAALPNPTKDSADVAAAFRRLGFSVRLVTDASYDDMRRAMLDFSHDARDSEMAVVFFAGHGMEINGDNWLIPVDAELRTDLDAEQEAISLRAVTLMVSAASKLGLVVLDACRNNPFAAKIKRTNATRAVTRGLSRVEPANSVLVVYAAKDGTTAADGAGGNSPFTTAFLKYLETPGIEINFLFRNVRDDVILATKNEQEPYVYGSLSKEAIYLVPPPIGGAATSSADQSAWSMLKDTADEAALRRFTSQYPKSELRKDAEARIAALEAAQAAKPPPPSPDEVTWTLLKETTDAAALKRFTAQYPNSPLRADAEARAAALTTSKTSQPTPPEDDDVTWQQLKGTTDVAALTRFVTQFPDSKSRKEAEARIAALTTPFDGKWTTVVSCRAAEGAGSFTILVEADVRGGLFNGEKGDRGKPGWYSLAGKVRPDGAVEVFARGIVPSSRLAAGNVPVGTPYGYAIKGRLEATKGTGARQGGRPCSVTFTKQ